MRDHEGGHRHRLEVVPAPAAARRAAGRPDAADGAHRERVGAVHLREQGGDRALPGDHQGDAARAAGVRAASVAMYIRKRRRDADEAKKRAYIEKYIPQVSIGLQQILELTDAQRDDVDGAASRRCSSAAGSCSGRKHGGAARRRREEASAAKTKAAARARTRWRAATRRRTTSWSSADPRCRDRGAPRHPQQQQAGPRLPGALAQERHLLGEAAATSRSAAARRCARSP